MITPRVSWALLASLLAFVPRSAVSDPEPPDSLLGLWATRLDFGPHVRGDLRITRQGARWQATIAGRRVAFVPRGDSLRFDLPNGAGGFRGTQTARGIEGFWLQPSGETEDRRDPGGSGQPFSTAVLLRTAGRDQWRGIVRPLDDHFTLYLKVFYNEIGTLIGAFRNPELNATGGLSRYRLFREGDSLWFSYRADTTEPWKPFLRGSITRSPERIRVFWPDLGRTLELSRRTPAQIPSFFPFPAGDTSYVYRRPPQLADGWTTARGRDAGMDEATLTRLVKRIIRTDPAGRGAPLIHSLLVAHRGRLVLEEYFFGHDRDTPHDMRSAGKTFGSVMLGAAMRQGKPISPETPIYRLLAERGPFARPDPRKSQITIAHLLTHTSGLDCNDNSESSLGNEGTMQSQRGQPDWWKYTLDLPMAHDPGTRYAYCSANSNLVGAALTTATRTWLPEYFHRTIAQPLEFGPYHWNLMPNGEGYLGGGAFLRPRDLLKIGQLFLDGGVWKGTRIVDSSWVRLSTAAHARISPATTGIPAEEFGEYYGEADEGYAWHLSRLRSGDREYRGYAATGNGGQILMVIPELDLVVVFTAGNYRQGGIWGRFGGEIVPNEIIPAILR